MNKLNNKISDSLSSVNDTVSYAENNNLINTQEFINFLDELNKLSVKY